MLTNVLSIHPQHEPLYQHLRSLLSFFSHTLLNPKKLGNTGPVAGKLVLTPLRFPRKRQAKSIVFDLRNHIVRCFFLSNIQFKSLCFKTEFATWGSVYVLNNLLWKTKKKVQN